MDFTVRNPVRAEGELVCQRGKGPFWLGQEGPPPPCSGALPPLPWKGDLARCPDCGLTHGTLPGDNILSTLYGPVF